MGAASRSTATCGDVRSTAVRDAARGTLTGFSIDCWHEIDARMAVKTSYQMMPDVKALFDSLRSGNADIAVSDLFYSTERDQEFDFSYPIMQVGFQIMVRDTGDTRRRPRCGRCWHCYFRARASSGSASRWCSS
ncbi:transporter substrate-binding domain-containing protein (plasmid) [Burkholderia sp. M6-3]